jgi:hypothetical protein
MLFKNTGLTALLLAAVFIQTTLPCELSTCVFNKEYNGSRKIIKINPPKKELWVAAAQLDGIDKTIFGQISLPYTYKKIINASQKQRFYVKSATYQKLIVIAQEQLHNKKQAIEAEYENIKKSPDFDGMKNMRLSAAIDRLEEYEKILKKNDRFEHLCPGIILTTQTKRCIALWTSLKQQ